MTDNIKQLPKSVVKDIELKNHARSLAVANIVSKYKKESLAVANIVSKYKKD